MVFVGLDEYKDIHAVINYVNSNQKLNGMKRAFFSMCTGANATIIAMKDKPELYQNIKCLFALQPVAANARSQQRERSLWTTEEFR